MAYSGKKFLKLYVVRDPQGRTIPKPQVRVPRMNPAQVGILSHFKPTKRA